MVENVRIRIARLFAGDFIVSLEKKVSDTETSVNQRVSSILSQMDPFEPLMKEYHGIFSVEYLKIEEGLDERSQIMMKMWAYQQRDDPSFKFMTQWIMDTQANETLKKASVTEARILYGRAQIACMILFVKEVKRLAVLYEEMIREKPGFDPRRAVE